MSLGVGRAGLDLSGGLVGPAHLRIRIAVVWKSFFPTPRGIQPPEVLLCITVQLYCGVLAMLVMSIVFNSSAQWFQ